MPTTRNRWQHETQQSPEPSPDQQQANQANADTNRQTSPQRPSVSPAPEAAVDLQHDPNPRSPKRRRISIDEDKLPTTSNPLPVPMSDVSAPAASATAQPTTTTTTTVSSTPVNGAIQSSIPPSAPAVPTAAPASSPTPAQPSNVPSPTMTGSASAPNPQNGTAPTPAAPGASTPNHGPPRTTVPPAQSVPTSGAPPPSLPPAPRGPPPPPAEVVKRRLDNLPLLNDTAGQILSLLSKMPVLDALSLDADLRLLASGQQPSSPAPAEYQRLRTLFDPVRNIYVSGFPFLIADHLMLKDASQVAIIRKANQAMFCSAVFAGGIGQLALDQAFLDVFVPMNDQLQQTQSCIWLELKTQGFMTAMRLKAAPPNQVMSDLFPQGTEHRLLARHPANKSLTMSEQDFMSRFEARRKTLYDHVARNTLPDLDQKFRYEELAREVTNFLIKTYGTTRSPAPPNGIATAPEASQPQGYAQAQTQSSTPANTSLPLPQLPASIDSLPSFDSGDFFQLAARAAEIALRGMVSPVIGTAKPVVQPSPIPAPQPRPNAAAQLGYQQQAPPQNGIQGTPNPPVSTANTTPAPGRTPLPTEQPKSGTTERIDQPPESGRHPQAGGVVKDAGSAENRDIKVERTAHNESMEEPSMDRHTSPVVASAVPAGSVGDDFEAMIAQAAEAASAT